MSKAFDTLRHNQIINNFSIYGIRDVERKLFINYLFDRKQLVNFRNVLSKPETVLYCVPQGSILGPLFFLLSFGDVGHALSHCNIIMYAHDTVIYTSAKVYKELQQKLSHDFNRVASWLESNDLIMNMKAGKTKCIIFGTSQKVKNQELNIAYRYQIVSKASTYKYLGLTLDQTLNLSGHLTKTYKKLLDV